MLTATIAILTALTVVILVAMGAAMALSIIFNADPYDDIHDTDN